MFYCLALADQTERAAAHVNIRIGLVADVKQVGKLQGTALIAALTAWIDPSDRERHNRFCKCKDCRHW
jgi:hypothetical protein